jgi:hypothetical protein
MSRNDIFICSDISDSVVFLLHIRMFSDRIYDFEGSVAFLLHFWL